MSKSKRAKLPCPVCRRPSETWVEFVPYFDGYGWDEKNLHHCGCKACGISASFLWSEDSAVAIWNAGEFDLDLYCEED